jgi:hypothetical protein
MVYGETPTRKKNTMDAKNIVIGTLVAAVAYDAVVNILNLKVIKKQKKTIKSLRRNAISNEERLIYLVDKCDRYELPVTDFEKIIFSNF